MSVWVFTESAYAHGNELIWDEFDDLPDAERDPRIQAAVKAWTERVGALVASKTAQTMTWVEDAEQFFSEQSSWSMLVALQIVASSIDHPEWPKLESMDEFEKHPGSKQPSVRFDQVNYYLWLPVDFEGSVEGPEMGSEETVKMGSSLALARQLRALYADLYGGCEDEMIGWQPARGEDASSVDYQVRFAFSVLGAAARASVANNVPIFVG